LNRLFVGCDESLKRENESERECERERERESNSAKHAKADALNATYW
jgi:hypothetical protein